MIRPGGIEPNYIEILEKYCDYLESFVGIIRTTEFKPLEGQPLEVLKQTARKALSDKPTKFVTTLCEKCRKPYCICKEQIKINATYPAKGGFTGTVIEFDGSLKMWKVEYSDNSIDYVDENGLALLRDNIISTPYDLVLIPTQ